MVPQGLRVELTLNTGFPSLLLLKVIRSSPRSPLAPGRSVPEAQALGKAGSRLELGSVV